MSNNLCKVCKERNKRIIQEQKELSKGMTKITIKIVGTDPLVVKRWPCEIFHQVFGYRNIIL